MSLGEGIAHLGIWMAVALSSVMSNTANPGGNFGGAVIASIWIRFFLAISGK